MSSRHALSASRPRLQAVNERLRLRSRSSPPDEDRRRSPPRNRRRPATPPRAQAARHTAPGAGQPQATPPRAQVTARPCRAPQALGPGLRTGLLFGKLEPCTCPYSHSILLPVRYLLTFYISRPHPRRPGRRPRRPRPIRGARAGLAAPRPSVPVRADPRAASVQLLSSSLDWGCRSSLAFVPEGSLRHTSVLICFMSLTVLTRALSAITYPRNPGSGILYVGSTYP